jgi:1-phosphofructokinase family hexose kinase
MLLVVCPNLAIDRILDVHNLTPGHVQRSRQALVQPGGKGSNVARVFRQLGGDVLLTGFVGRDDARSITEPLSRLGIHVDAIRAYEKSRTCTIICDSKSDSHPTVINEESPEVGPSAAGALLKKIDRWLARVDGVLTTGSLSTGLPAHLYAEVLSRARSRGKITAIDATGDALRAGLAVHPTFAKPNTAEMRELFQGAGFSPLAAHTAFTFGKAGAAVIVEGKCLYAPPPRIYGINPVGAGDAFAAGYLKSLLQRRNPSDCLRLALASAACDAATLRPGFINHSEVGALAREVVPRFTAAR